MYLKIVLTGNQKLFFTSDTHFDHKNICRGTTEWKDSEDMTRDYKTLDDMNNDIVDKFNEVVGQDDILIHHGDWSFNGFDNIRKFRERLVCRNIHLVLGNHDHHIEKNKDDIQSIFSSVSDVLKLDVRIPTGAFTIKKSFICFHYPIASWPDMQKGVIHTHGHVHLPPHKRIADGKAMDVGIDGNNGYPIDVREIMKLMKDRPIKKLVLPSDHHEREL